MTQSTQTPLSTHGQNSAGAGQAELAPRIEVTTLVQVLWGGAEQVTKADKDYERALNEGWETLHIGISAYESATGMVKHTRVVTLSRLVEPTDAPQPGVKEGQAHADAEATVITPGDLVTAVAEALSPLSDDAADLDETQIITPVTAAAAAAPRPFNLPEGIEPHAFLTSPTRDLLH